MRWWIAASVILATSVTPALADAPELAPQYGFTEDTDVGVRGEIGWEVGVEGQLGRSAGTYRALTSYAAAKFTVADGLRLSPLLLFDSTHIKNVPGMSDRSQTAFGGAGFAAKYQILDRAEGLLGLAIAAAPYWRQMDGDSGAAARQMGSGFLIAAEHEILPRRLFGAFNVFYEMNASRDRQTADWTHASSLGVFGALALAILPDFMVSTELRYLRAYDGLGLNRLTGEALFAGPGFSIQLRDKLQMSAAWNVQIAGYGNDVPGRLDLSNFSRHRFLLKLEGLF